jgi:hypothetical protein
MSFSREGEKLRNLQKGLERREMLAYLNEVGVKPRWNRIVCEDDGLCEEWENTLDHLTRRKRPVGIQYKHWLSILGRLQILLYQELDKLIDMQNKGWSLLMLTACHKTRPTDRIDAAGLLLILPRYESIVSVTENEIKLRTVEKEHTAKKAQFITAAPSDVCTLLDLE